MADYVDAEAGDEAHQKEKKSQATLLVQLVDRHDGVELFHAPDDKPYAHVPVGDHHETWPLRSRAFRRWAAGLFFAEYEKAPGSQAVQDALAVLEARALFDGPEVPVHVRIARHFDAIYLDLADEDWHVVQVTPEGWSVRSGSPVRFRRPSGMQPLPHPALDGSIEDLRDFVNVKEDDWELLLGTLIAFFHPDMPYPVANFLGEQGSAKTTTARVLRSLIDPSAAPVRTSPRTERDLMVAATSSWVTVIDNLSDIKDWLSDSIARLSTGGGMAVRELYTDDEPFLFDARRPVLMNGITEVVTRPDLLDRCVIFDVPRITRHRNEADLWGAFEEVRPGILGTLLDAVAFGLKNLPHVQRDGLPRMADFARWAMACAPALSVRSEDFLSAYRRNREAANRMALEVSAVAAVVTEFVDKGGSWTGPISNLLYELNDLADEAVKNDRAWPATSRKLSGDLRRVIPNLRRDGILVTPPGPNDRPRLWELEQARIEPSDLSDVSGMAPDQQERSDRSPTHPDGRDGRSVGSVGDVSGKTAGRDGSDTSDGISQPRSNPVDAPDPETNGYAPGDVVRRIGGLKSVQFRVRAMNGSDAVDCWDLDHGVPRGLRTFQASELILVRKAEEKEEAR